MIQQANTLFRNPLHAQSEANSDSPHHELYELADLQVRENSNEKADAPSERVAEDNCKIKVGPADFIARK